MKICKNCGAYNSDDRKFCADCEKLLGASVSADEEKRIRDALDDKLDDLYENGEPFKIETIDYILGIASAVAFAAQIVTLIVSVAQGGFEGAFVWMILIGLFCTGFSLMSCFLPEWLHEIDVFFLELQYRNAYDLTPNAEHFLISRRIGSALMSVAILVMIWLMIK